MRGMETPGSPVYPVGLRLEGRRVVVVGGGAVALRRVGGLLVAGAAVTVVAPARPPRRWPTWPRSGAAPGHGARTARRPGRRLAGDGLHRRPRGERARSRPRPRPRASCACGPTTRRRRARGSPRPAGPGRTPWRCTPTATRPGPPRCATVWSRAAAAVAGPVRPTPAAGPRTGRVVLVGGGPGDPGLLTLRGRAALAEADVVVADRLAPLAVLDELARRRDGRRRREGARRPLDAAGGDQPAAGRARPGRAGRGPAQGRRPVRVRPRHGGARRPASRAGVAGRGGARA